MELTALEERLGYRFVTPGLLEQAVTHRSHGAVHNERLEFLGDAVLNCTIAQLLFAKYARLNEGDLSRLRANLVKQSSLADIGERIGLADFMRLGEGEMKSGGFRRPSILADTVEAIFGAVMVDGGFEPAREAIARQFEPILKHVDPKTLGKDSKTLLQEYLQGKRLPLPLYTVVETRGAAHNQEFEVECAIPKLEISVRGTGRSRRAAEQNAAKLAFETAQTTLQAARRAKRKTTAEPDMAVREAADADDGARDRTPEPERKAQRSERHEKSDKAERHERNEKTDKTDKADKAEPAAEKTVEKQAAEKQTADKTADKHAADRHAADKHAADKAADKQPTEKPAEEHSADKAAADKSAADRTASEKTAADKAAPTDKGSSMREIEGSAPVGTRS
jgi:ribonuclease-3